MPIRDGRRALGEERQPASDGAVQPSLALLLGRGLSNHSPSGLFLQHTLQAPGTSQSQASCERIAF